MEKPLVDVASECIARSIKDCSEKTLKEIEGAIKEVERVAFSRAANYLLKMAQNNPDDIDMVTTIQQLAVGVENLSSSPCLSKPTIAEEIAEMIHVEWVCWSTAVSDEVSSERRNRWRLYWGRYSELPEQVKEQDRVWARKMMMRITPHLEKMKLEQYGKFVEYLGRAMDLHNQGQLSEDEFLNYRNQVMAEVLAQIQEERLTCK
jgi:hypothetical protein